MRRHSLPRERSLTTLVWLLEHTFIRVGNKAYVKANKSYGLTTLRGQHVSVAGDTVQFNFKGKSGVFHEVAVRQPRIAKTIRQCIELPGYELFQYLDGQHHRQSVDSHDVNEYLKQVTGESLSAKDFRTWGGTTLAGEILYRLGEPQSSEGAKAALVTAVEKVASHLRNTTAVCRQYYIHPKIIASYEEHALVPHFKKVFRSRQRQIGVLSKGEHATWTLLQIS